MARVARIWGTLVVCTSLSSLQLVRPAAAQAQLEGTPEGAAQENEAVPGVGGDGAAEPEPSIPDSLQACVEAHRSGQIQRKDGRLLAARETLLSCATNTCPGLVQKDCLRWVDELGAQIPSVVFRVLAKGDNSRASVRAFLDGQSLGEQLPSRALELDPGRHRFRFELPSYPAVERDVMVNEGNKFQVIQVEFVAPETVGGELAIGPRVVAPQAEPRRPIPLGAFVLGGVSLAAAGGFVGFGLATRKLEGQYQDTCSPECSQAKIDRVEQRALAADVSAVISLAALAGATTFYLLRPTQNVQVGAGLDRGRGMVASVRVSIP